MQTPFFGISVIFHIGVIFVRLLTLFVLKALNKERIESEIPVKNREFINTVIMLFVFLLVLYGATTMVMLSINSKYSTINYVAGYLNTNSSTVINNDLLAIDTNELPDYIELAPSTLVNIPCDDVTNYVQNEISGLQLVDYLVYTGRNHTFSARKTEAISRGLDNYLGTGIENVWLLKEFMKEDGYVFELPTSCQNQ